MENKGSVFGIFPCRSGPTQWRDQLKPTELLNNLSKLKNYDLPVIQNSGRRFNIGEKEFLLEDFGKVRVHAE